MRTACSAAPSTSCAACDWRALSPLLVVGIGFGHSFGGLFGTHLLLTVPATFRRS